eukprot:Clim_evm21s47 gene=Clim_evmTU21s47
MPTQQSQIPAYARPTASSRRRTGQTVETDKHERQPLRRVHTNAPSKTRIMKTTGIKSISAKAQASKTQIPNTQAQNAQALNKLEKKITGATKVGTAEDKKILEQEITSLKRQLACIQAENARLVKKDLREPFEHETEFDAELRDQGLEALLKERLEARLNALEKLDHELVKVSIEFEQSSHTVEWTRGC